ncbi:MAG: GNAT family N-acetyltransferase [Saprospiraceae bacterium]|nr:GNAT family N-acetyltransferase [Saprospiraceae bacterium]
MPFPILTTERLTLRPLLPDDEQGIFALRSDREINKYLARQPARTIEEARNFINKLLERLCTYCVDKEKIETIQQWTT